MGRIDLGWVAGRRRYKTVYGKTRKAVASRMPKLLQEAQHGTVIMDERVTVGRFLDRWLRHKQSRLRARTLTTYQIAVELHLAPGIGKIPLARLTPQHVDDWFHAHQGAGASARTIQYARAVLRAALNQALRWNLVSRNVAALIEPPRHVARQIQPLSPDQARTLLRYVAEHRLAAVVSVAMALGLRIGEALGLQWADVNFESGTLSVTRALERSGGDRAARRPLLQERRALRQQLAATAKRSAERREIRRQLAVVREQLKPLKSTLRFTEPKSVRSRRTINMPQVVIAALKTHRTRQLEERLAAGASWEDTNLVFTTPIGTPLEPRNVGREFDQMLKAAGVPDIRFHDLRHTAATLLLVQGVDPRTTMATLGHSQISLTLNTYTHVLPALQGEAAAKMDAILSKVTA